VRLVLVGEMLRLGRKRRNYAQSTSGVHRLTLGLHAATMNSNGVAVGLSAPVSYLAVEVVAVGSAV
jgi:hypothetical protein